MGLKIIFTGGHQVHDSAPLSFSLLGDVRNFFLPHAVVNSTDLSRPANPSPGTAKIYRAKPHHPTATRLIPEALLAKPNLLMLALPGLGCSPQIYDAIRLKGVKLEPIDWTLGNGPFDPESVARRVGAELSVRTAPTILLGHSLGAFIALLVALQVPSHVQGLVISNTGAQTTRHGDPLLPQRIARDWTPSNQALFLRGCFMTQPPPALWANMLAYLASVNTVTLLQAVEGLRQLDLVAQLTRIDCPTLIAHGQYDQRRHVSDAEQLAAGIASSSLQLLPGGHTPMVDCPTDYQAAIDAFVSRNFHPFIN